MKKFFNNWNYKKHAAIVSGVYLTLYAIDMTVGYLAVKKCLKSIDEKRAAREIEIEE